MWPCSRVQAHQKVGRLHRRYSPRTGPAPPCARSWRARPRRSPHARRSSSGCPGCGPRSPRPRPEQAPHSSCTGGAELVQGVQDAVLALRGRVLNRLHAPPAGAMRASSMRPVSVTIRHHKGCLGSCCSASPCRLRQRRGRKRRRRRAERQRRRDAQRGGGRCHTGCRCQSLQMLQQLCANTAW